MPRTGRKCVCLVCHGAPSSNSGRHVLALSVELAKLGWDILACFPSLDGQRPYAPLGITVYSYDEFFESTFRDSPVLYHYWTPREIVRQFGKRIADVGVLHPKYLVHFEDDESILLRDQLGSGEKDVSWVKQGRPATIPLHLTHPMLGKEFVTQATALTALTRELLLGQPELPHAVFWPGYDSAFESLVDPFELSCVKSRLNIPEANYVLTYTGNVHPSNRNEVLSLYLAVALVNRKGLPLTLIRTGENAVPLTNEPREALAISQNVVELGRVPKSRLPALLQAADILVQPGLDDPWNQRRVPSKLAEFLVSGRAVILPRSNLGSILSDGINALVLPHATAENIAMSLLRWLTDVKARDAIGKQGREFAMQKLQWSLAALKVSSLYEQILFDNE